MLFLINIWNNDLYSKPVSLSVYMLLSLSPKLLFWSQTLPSAHAKNKCAEWANFQDYTIQHLNVLFMNKLNISCHKLATCIPSNVTVVLTDKQPAKSAYFTEAEERVHVPFLHHQLLKCDCNGWEYTIQEHDITLRIPEGAVSKGEEIHFEIGVAMHGPFTFPENMRPVSPVIWLCILEEGVDLKKPFQLILPHFLTGLSKERLQFHQIRFAKANHKDLSLRDNQQMYRFNSCTKQDSPCFKWLQKLWCHWINTLLLLLPWG